MKKFFYGWIILPAAIIGTLASIPGQTVGVSVFTDFLIEVHDISRSGVSFAYLVGTIGSALLLSWAGRLYDRFGARIIGVPVALALSGTLFLLSVSDHAAGFLSGRLNIPAAAASFAVLTILFFLVRFFGQGNLTLISRNMVMKWFDKRRGLANAFLGVSISLGFSASPGVIDKIITSSGWRETWRMMALALAAVSLFIFLIYRDKPADMGQKPDGGWVGPEGGQRSRLGRLKRIQSMPEVDFDLHEARRGPLFWLIALTLAMSSLLVTASTFHVVSIFGESGIPREQAVILFLPASIVAVIFQFVGSSLSSFIKERYLVIVQLAGGILAAGAAMGTGVVSMQILFVLGIGLSQGMMGINSAILFPRLYGLTHLGAISGFAMALGVAGSAVGPFVFSLSLDFFGSYRSAGILFAAMEMGLLLFAVIKRDFTPVKDTPVKY
jgi:MFS family permease